MALIKKKFTFKKLKEFHFVNLLLLIPSENFLCTSFHSKFLQVKSTSSFIPRSWMPCGIWTLSQKRRRYSSILNLKIVDFYYSFTYNWNYVLFLNRNFQVRKYIQHNIEDKEKMLSVEKVISWQSTMVITCF